MLMQGLDDDNKAETLSRTTWTYNEVIVLEDHSETMNSSIETGGMHNAITANRSGHHCSYYSRYFNHKSTLMVHERMHANDRPFICSYCDKAFCTSE